MPLHRVAPRRIMSDSDLKSRSSNSVEMEKSANKRSTRLKGKSKKQPVRKQDTRTMWHNMGQFGVCMNPQPETDAGRVVQMLWAIFLALLAVIGIVVQVYTDAQLSTLRSAASTLLTRNNVLTSELYDIALLLTDEMEPMYEYNNAPYSVFREKAHDIMKNVNAKLLWNDIWITEFEDIPNNERANISSALTLRLALRNQRDARKSSNNTSEAQIINFYSTVVDNLVVAAQSITLHSTRFDGWKEYLGILHIFQALSNLRKYALVGKKMAADNRNITSVKDPVILSLVDYYMKYNEFMQIAAIDAPFIGYQVKNITNQDSAKTLNGLHVSVLKQDFATLNPSSWNDATSKQIASLQWLLSVLRMRLNAAVINKADDWTYIEIFSVVFLVVAGLFSAVAVPAHIVGTWRLQNQIEKYHDHLELLNQAYSLVYDCVPKSLIRMKQITSVTYFPDLCVLMVDIMNVQKLTNQMESEELISFFTSYHETVEFNLANYNCFKLGVNGDCFSLCSGLGEFHPIDHVVEMIFLGLDLIDALHELNVEKESGQEIRLRVGVHCGPCYARLVKLQIPNIAIAGDVAQTATLIHAFGLPMKVLASSDVYNRLKNSTELTFFSRGVIEFEDGDLVKQLDTFWVTWSDDEYFYNTDSLSSAASESSLLLRTPSMNSETSHHHHHHHLPQQGTPVPAPLPDIMVETPPIEESPPPPPHHPMAAEFIEEALEELEEIDCPTSEDLLPPAELLERSPPARSDESDNHELEPDDHHQVEVHHTHSHHSAIEKNDSHHKAGDAKQHAHHRPSTPHQAHRHSSLEPIPEDGLFAEHEHHDDNTKPHHHHHHHHHHQQISIDRPFRPEPSPPSTYTNPPHELARFYPPGSVTEHD